MDESRYSSHFTQPRTRSERWPRRLDLRALSSAVAAARACARAARDDPARGAAVAEFLDSVALLRGSRWQRFVAGRLGAGGARQLGIETGSAPAVRVAPGVSQLRAEVARARNDPSVELASCS